MDRLKIFIDRLNKIGIDIQIYLNFPWTYLGEINKIKVTEIYGANHGFNIGYMPIKEDKKFEFDNIKEMFELIREYCNKETNEPV